MSLWAHPQWRIDMADDKIDRALEQVDPAKRAFLKGLVGGGAFLAPMVVSFSMEGVSLYQAHAGAASNTTRPPFP